MIILLSRQPLTPKAIDHAKAAMSQAIKTGQTLVLDGTMFDLIEVETPIDDENNHVCATCGGAIKQIYKGHTQI